jgi:hypothetical protein
MQRREQKNEIRKLPRCSSGRTCGKLGQFPLKQKKGFVEIGTAFHS